MDGHRGQRASSRRDPLRTPRALRPGEALAANAARRAYDCAVIRPTGANGCCRVTFQANRYAVPYLYASQKLTDAYPLQLRSPNHEFAGWVKHRWAG